MSLTPQQRALRARIAANSRVAKPDYDPREATRPATRARWQRYEAQVDPEGKLSPEARRKKAVALWQADMDRAKLAKSQGKKPTK